MTHDTPDTSADPPAGRSAAPSVVGDIDAALVRLVRRITDSRTTAMVNGWAGVDVERSGFTLMARLEDTPDVRLADLADSADIDVSTASRQVGRLIDHGLAERGPDPLDHRARRLRLTEHGAATLARLRAARRDWIGTIVAEFDDEDRVRFAELFTRFVDGVHTVGRMHDSLVIRAERPADHDAIRQVVADAFGSPAEADLVDAIRASPDYVAEMALVAERDGEVLGHVMISGATLRDESTTHPIVMLSPLAVAPAHQGLGIGGALVREVTGLADLRGEPFVIVEGDPRYYGRFGFEHSVGHGIELPLPDWAPPEAGQLLRLANDDPELRGTVVYPPAFDGVS